MTVAPRSAAVRTAIASVSTLPEECPSTARYLTLDCRIAMTDDTGCDSGKASGIGGGGDDPGDQRAVCVAVLAAVAGRHVVAARDHTRQLRVRGHPGVDHCDFLACTGSQRMQCRPGGRVRASVGVEARPALDDVAFAVASRWAGRASGAGRCRRRGSSTAGGRAAASAGRATERVRGATAGEPQHPEPARRSWQAHPAYRPEAPGTPRLPAESTPQAKHIRQVRTSALGAADVVHRRNSSRQADASGCCAVAIHAGVRGCHSIAAGGGCETRRRRPPVPRRPLEPVHVERGAQDEGRAHHHREAAPAMSRAARTGVPAAPSAADQPNPRPGRSGRDVRPLALRGRPGRREVRCRHARGPGARASADNEARQACAPVDGPRGATARITPPRRRRRRRSRLKTENTGRSERENRPPIPGSRRSRAPTGLQWGRRQGGPWGTVDTPRGRDRPPDRGQRHRSVSPRPPAAHARATAPTARSNARA